MIDAAAAAIDDAAPLRDADADFSCCRFFAATLSA